MLQYRYTMKGTAADNQTWTTTGEVKTVREDDWPRALDQAQRDSFMQLTRGKAVFGLPGVGCRGPYQITKFEIERV